MKKTDIITTLISLASSLFIAGTACAVLLIETYKANSSMMPIWDKRFLITMLLGTIIIIIAIIIFILVIFKKNNDSI